VHLISTRGKALAPKTERQSAGHDRKTRQAVVIGPKFDKATLFTANAMLQSNQP
jgi:hypothetical protein